MYVSTIKTRFDESNDSKTLDDLESFDIRDLNYDWIRLTHKFDAGILKSVTLTVWCGNLTSKSCPPELQPPGVLFLWEKLYCRVISTIGVLPHGNHQFLLPFLPQQ